MPKGRGGRRRKRRTHAAELQEAKAVAALPDNVPRSFVFKSGRVAGCVKELAAELRQLMGPFTAVKLRVRGPPCRQVSGVLRGAEQERRRSGGERRLRTTPPLQRL
eukprot:scaffold1396_cov252-Pinguiococcus_pyrenoidosus.AAC.17